MTEKKTLTCILHTQSTTSTGKSLDVKKFDIEKWTKVVACADVRSKRAINKYKAVCDTLPATPSENDGYHSSCYKNFTAVQLPPETDSGVRQRSLSPVLRSDLEHPSTSSSGVFETKCIFCGVERKTLKNRSKECLGSCETKDAEVAIKQATIDLDDEEMIRKIGSVCFIAKEIKYHHGCRKAYLYLARAKAGVKEKVADKFEQCHKSAFAAVCEYVDCEIIKKCSAEKLATLIDRYKQELLVLGIPEPSIVYTTQKLKERLTSCLSDKIKIEALSKKHGNIVYSSNIDIKHAVHTVDSNCAIADSAMQLRSLILQEKDNAKPLPVPLTPSSLSEGEITAPDALLRFFHFLYTGSATKQVSEKTERLVKSSADDVLYNVFRGSLKPAKQLCLGLGMKSLTGSRKVIEVLNRFGHSISYSVAEELETDLASSVIQENKTTPDGILCERGLSTGLAWDNYDENTETLSCADTLYDTFGICYQNLTACDPVTGDITIHHCSSGILDTPLDDTEANIEQALPGYSCTNHPTTGIQTGLQESTAKGVKRKRSIDVQRTEVMPYRKNPKISTFNYPIRSIPVPHNLRDIIHKDIAWAMSCAVLDGVPMWVGWNSLLTRDHLPHHMLHAKSISATNAPRCGRRRLRLSQNVAAECGEDYAIVTYDLAVAKIAMQIIDAESPTFDNVFVCLGAFHIAMAYFLQLDTSLMDLLA